MRGQSLIIWREIYTYMIVISYYSIATITLIVTNYYYQHPSLRLIITIITIIFITIIHHWY